MLEFSPIDFLALWNNVPVDSIETRRFPFKLAYVVPYWVLETSSLSRFTYGLVWNLEIIPWFCFLIRSRSPSVRLYGLVPSIMNPLETWSIDLSTMHMSADCFFPFGAQLHYFSRCSALSICKFTSWTLLCTLRS